MLSLLLQAAYLLVDMLIVGNFASVPDVSAVSTGSQFMNIIIVFGSGLTNGATVELGQDIGRGQQRQLGSILCHSVYVVMGTAFLLAVPFLLLNDQVVGWLNTPTKALVETKTYIFYCTLGIPLVFAYNLLSGICRGFGNSKAPLVGVAVACTLNLLGDLLLVGVFHMGAAGAAIATMIAQAVSVLFTLWLIRRKRLLPVSLNWADTKWNWAHCKAILRLGLPQAFQLTISSFSFLMITAMVNRFDVVVSAAVGLSNKLTHLLMLVPLAFMQSVSVFAAQNHGAKQFARGREGLWVAIFTSLAVGTVFAYITWFHGEALVGLFNHDQAVIGQAALYLKAYSIDILLSAFMYCLSGYLSGCGHTVFVMLEGLFCAFLIRVPLFYLLSQTIQPLDLFLTGLSNPLTTLVQSLICLVCYGWMKNKIEQSKESILCGTSQELN